jgi:hypothetical protein
LGFFFFALISSKSFRRKKKNPDALSHTLSLCLLTKKKGIWPDSTGGKLFWAGYRGVEEGSVRPSPTKKSAIKAVYRDITVAVSLRARKAHRATATTRERERERERE